MLLVTQDGFGSEEISDPTTGWFDIWPRSPGSCPRGSVHSCLDWTDTPVEECAKEVDIAKLVLAELFSILERVCLIFI